MRLSLRTTLLASYLGLVALVVGVTLAQLSRQLSEDLHRQLDARLTEQARGVAAWIGESKHWSRLAGRLAGVVHAQVTIVDEDGTWLGDSTASPSRELDSPRPLVRTTELDAARATGFGAASRDDGDGWVRHVAVRRPDGIVVRLSVPLAEVDATVDALHRRLAWAGAVAASVAIALAGIASRMATRRLRAMTEQAGRLAAGHYDDPLGASPSARFATEFETLARALTHLASELKARIAELTNERDHVRKLLLQRRHLIADVSHELRTPIAAVQGYAETLLAGQKDPETTKTYLEIVHRHAVRLGSLVERLLHFSALEAQEGVTAERVALPVAAVLEGVRATFGDRAAREGVTLEVVAETDALLWADPEAVEEVMGNLVDNALKYGRPGGHVRIVGRVAPTPSNGEPPNEPWVELSVADDGPGIPAEHLPHVFERFYRVDPSRSREAGGAGLGLAIVRQRVETMGGTVSAESPAWAGTTFRVRLPMADAHTAPPGR